jgi:hypothetical protein
MSKFADVVNKLVTISESHPLVNTVIVAVAGEERDLYKKNIHPMVHILPQGMLIEPNSIVHRFEIAVLNDRDVSKTLERQKIGDNSNALDNINTTSEILVQILGELQLFRGDEFIFETIPDVQILFLSGINMVDGVFSEIEIRTPKALSGIC